MKDILSFDPAQYPTRYEPMSEFSFMTLSLLLMVASEADMLGFQDMGWGMNVYHKRIRDEYLDGTRSEGIMCVKFYYGQLPDLFVALEIVDGSGTTSWKVPLSKVVKLFAETGAKQNGKGLAASYWDGAKRWYTMNRREEPNALVNKTAQSDAQMN